jgi:hypothetical protein
MKDARARVTAGKQPETNDAMHHYARNFLVHSMNEFCAGYLRLPKNAEWTDRLFFMELDRIFDQELLGFPHPTESGLQSMLLLQSNGYSIVLNTGRSVQHVRKYCEAYKIPGGVAEYGSVFVDAVNQTEVPLIDSAGAEQLARCRDMIRTLPGVFVDSGYEYSIRAYRYKGQTTTGLAADEISSLLKRPEFSDLTYIARPNDTYIVQKRTSKGAAVTFVKEYLGSHAPITAIAHAPATCSPAGLLAAVRHRLKNDGRRRDELSKPVLTADHCNTLLQTLLHVADRALPAQIFAILVSWNL